MCVEDSNVIADYLNIERHDGTSLRHNSASDNLRSVPLAEASTGSARLNEVRDAMVSKRLLF